MAINLDGWDMVSAADTEWMPWGATGDARAKVLGSADGYMVTFVEAEAGYVGGEHEHTAAEFFYLVSGEVRNQGRTLTAGDGYAAAAGTLHSDFEALTPATYVVIFRL
jgi:hypothetical protein